MLTHSQMHTQAWGTVEGEGNSLAQLPKVFRGALEPGEVLSQFSNGKTVRVWGCLLEEGFPTMLA